MKLAITILLGLSSFFSFSQNDVSARFPGGDNAYNRLLNERLVFPQKALDAGASREIRALVRIDTLGQVGFEKFIFENSGLGFEEEVLRFLDIMPNWVPALHNGKVSTSQIVLTFNFTYIDPNLEVDETTYTYYLSKDVDVEPIFPFGIDSLNSFVTNFLRDTLQLRFDTASATISLIINTQGTVVDGKVLSSNNAVADGYWLHALKHLPAWIPARLKEETVIVQEELSFELISE